MHKNQIEWVDRNGKGFEFRSLCEMLWYDYFLIYTPVVLTLRFPVLERAANCNVHAQTMHKCKHMHFVCVRVYMQCFAIERRCCTNSTHLH